MEKARYFATPINKTKFRVTEIEEPKEVFDLGSYSYLIIDKNGDEYTSSNLWSFNYSIYDDDVEIDFDGKDISNEKFREYIFKAGVLTIKEPKSFLFDKKNGLQYILTKDNRIYRIRPVYFSYKRIL